MKKSKEQKAQEKLAALLGMEAPTAVSKAEANQRSMEAEAALEYYENPRSFTEKNCKQCGLSFATRGAPVAYCSDPCRVRAFEERMGVKWQPLRPATERWGFMGEPLTVPHEALVVVQTAMAYEEERRQQDNAEQREFVDNTRLNAMVETIYGPVIERQQAAEQELLDMFREFGIE